MNSILTSNYSIHFNSNSYTELNSYLKAHYFTKLFVLVDTNTLTHCYPKFISNIETSLEIEIIEISDGETHKNIDTCVGVWSALSELNADRKSLIINLGGGVVTDLGGFVASTFKRGLRYINVPTSLLAMVDASVGGKTGVDLGHLKNQIGLINTPEFVLVDINFLKTLPELQMRSGLAEMLKHGLIKDEKYWDTFENLDTLSSLNLDELIHESILIKNEIVTQDPSEENMRKTLNFGHTLGHAIESYFLSNHSKESLLHGEAVAIGMILACYISTQKTGLDINTNNKIKKKIIDIYGINSITQDDVNPIIELLKHDKKNEAGKVNFVLLKSIGEPVIDCQVENSIIEDAFKFYNS